MHGKTGQTRAQASHRLAPTNTNMQSRITKKFGVLKKSGQKAFIPFITAGDPDLKTTEKIIFALEEAGASVIELGVPFTDPMADGVAIQKSYERALKKGVTLKSILDLVKRVRKKSQIPILLMGYYNPILNFGLEKFAAAALESGVDGLLVVDLPVEESAALKAALKNKPIDLIYLLTPTSTPARVARLSRKAKGFIYYVSMTGVTGSASLDPKAVTSHVRQIRSNIKLPVCVGFGISTPAHVKILGPAADGVVVGSALIKIIEKARGKKNLEKSLAKFVSSLAGALK